jgi:hypothetical protein
MLLPHITSDLVPQYDDHRETSLHILSHWRYTGSYIKSWADALANLLIEQGGFPEREMWPERQLNERQPSSAKTEGGFYHDHEAAYPR